VLSNAAILIIKIGFLKARQLRAFKKPILLFPAPLALETTKLVSECELLYEIAKTS
jgi:hypothetical protein